MDELISFLGANYTIFERWGVVFLAVLAAAGGVCLWQLIRKNTIWRRVLAGLGLLPVLAGLAITTFVLRNIEPLRLPNGYARADVSFAGPAGALGGELLTPQGPGRRAALVLAVGSDISSYRTNYAPLVNDLLVPQAAEAQFVMLFFDKRGVGRSAGDWTIATIEDRAADARAAMTYLQNHPAVDPGKVVVIGHSQGGWVAQLLAAQDPPPALAVSLAGPAVGVEQQILDDERGSRLCNGATEAQADAEARALVADLRQQSRGNVSGRLRQFSAIADYRPDAALKSLKAPTVFVFGTNDRLVPAQANLARLKELWGDQPAANTTVVTVEGAGHSLRLIERCHRGPQRDKPFAPEVINQLRSSLASVNSR
ncbi:MAG: alpha/beta hydrolase [Rhodospirillaceae bacterium]|nr:alpha/beta hydrolase [Rhodospirillaceae bacterium]